MTWNPASRRRVHTENRREHRHALQGGDRQDVPSQARTEPAEPRSRGDERTSLRQGCREQMEMRKGVHQAGVGLDASDDPRDNIRLAEGDANELAQRPVGNSIQAGVLEVLIENGLGGGRTHHEILVAAAEISQYHARMRLRPIHLARLEGLVTRYRGCCASSCSEGCPQKTTPARCCSGPPQDSTSITRCGSKTSRGFADPAA